MDGNIFWMGYDNLIYEYTLKYLSKQLNAKELLNSLAFIVYTEG